MPHILLFTFFVLVLLLLFFGYSKGKDITSESKMFEIVSVTSEVYNMN
ncbi:hypothetical protein [Paenibacillus macquariensis]|uniref:Uncharacterized protein n=1 Tax=Paenibacillus macquariensis TaxID=948756 RepID=A0ABY1JP33_9BACL|nr:hypothetical protein [Paenibacillus macquariensis]MEC0092054.1 hypothetical protein [Paenibacillus macquariensis]SIQ51959.1 hypothetical protein SAMN05421578_102379 [Paenibacillus macquariensis]